MFDLNLQILFESIKIEHFIIIFLFSDFILVEF